MKSRSDDLRRASRTLCASGSLVLWICLRASAGMTTPERVTRCFDATDTDYAPWYIVRSDDKKRARLNCIAHLLNVIPYKRVRQEKIKLPKRSTKRAYDDQATLAG